MGQPSSRERKIRGSKLRASREEKRARKREKEKQARKRENERLRFETGPRTTHWNGHTPTPHSSDPVTPEASPFVETAAVREIHRRIDRWLTVDRPVHLIGPTGCGKTALAMQVARDRDRPVVWINGDTDLSTSDLVGDFAEKERISERDKYIHNVIKSKDIIRDRWVDNPLTIAVRDGATLVYNEFARTKPVANNVLLSVFEEGVLELPGQRGESRYIDVHPEFRAILTSNSIEYAGVHEPQDALLDRLIGVYMDFYDFDTEVEIVTEHVGDAVSRERIELIVSVMRDLRDELDIPVGTRAAIMAAEGFTVTEGTERESFIEVCVDTLASKVAQHGDVLELREHVTAVIENNDLPIE